MQLTNIHNYVLHCHSKLQMEARVFSKIERVIEIVHTLIIFTYLQASMKLKDAYSLEGKL